MKRAVYKLRIINWSIYVGLFFGRGENVKLKKNNDACEICAASVDEKSQCPCCGHVNSSGVVDWKGKDK